jgi:hypothetical protein
MTKFFRNVSYRVVPYRTRKTHVRKRNLIFYLSVAESNSDRPELLKEQVVVLQPHSTKLTLPHSHTNTHTHIHTQTHTHTHAHTDTQTHTHSHTDTHTQTHTHKHTHTHTHTHTPNQTKPFI